MRTEVEAALRAQKQAMEALIAAIAEEDRARAAHNEAAKELQRCRDEVTKEIKAWSDEL